MSDKPKTYELERGKDGVYEYRGKTAPEPEPPKTAPEPDGGANRPRPDDRSPRAKAETFAREVIEAVSAITAFGAMISEALGEDSAPPAKQQVKRKKSRRPARYQKD